MLNNLGTLGVIILGLVPLVIFQFIVAKCFCKFKCCFKLAHRLVKWLYFGAILRVIIESYVISFLCSLVNLQAIEFDSGDHLTEWHAMILSHVRFWHWKGIFSYHFCLSSELPLFFPNFVSF